MKKNFSLLVLACALACAGETLLDVDFAASTRRVDAEGVGSFHGVLPARVNENFTGWSAGRVTTELKDEGARTFLRLATKPGDAGGQFAIGGFEPQFPGFFRLRVTARVVEGGPLSFGLRLNGEPYTGYSQHAFSSGTWEEKSWLFAVNRKREGSVGLYFYTGPGMVDVARIALETATEADLAAEIPRPPKTVRSFVRHARFPLGLPCGWNLGRDCVGTTCVADREEPAADGVPVLKVVSETPWELRGEAFQTGYPGESHTLSFSYRSAEPVQAGVLDERGRSVAGRMVPASADWREERIVFRAPMLAHSLGLRFAGAKGPFRLDRVGVSVGDGAVPPRDACAVALAAVEGAIAAETRIQFADEPARVAFRVLGAPEGCALKATATDLYGRTRPLRASAGWEGALDYGVFPEAPLGQFRVSAWLERDGKRVSGEEELVVTRLARPVAWGRDAPDSPFGCHFNPNRGVVKTMKAGGVNWVRLHDAGERVSNWYAQEPEKGKWDFHDAEVAVYRDAGVKIFAQLGTAPTWATHYGDLGYSWLGYFEKYLRPTNDVDWVEYVTRYVKHHEKNIDEYFVWNEPWGRWWESAADIKYYDRAKAGADFAALQRLAYDAVKRVNPKIRVAGFNTTSGTGGRKWTADVLAGGGFDSCDVVDWHYYTSHPRGLRDETSVSAVPLEPIRKQHPDLGGKPFYMSEGQGTSNGSAWIDERMSGLLKASVPWPEEKADAYSRIADMTCRYVVSLLAEGNAKVYLYSAHAYGGLAQVPTFLTLLGADGYAHPALVAHAQLARALEGTRFARKENAGRAGVRYVFEAATSIVSVYTNLAKDEMLARLRKEPLVDLYGNPVTAATCMPGTIVYASVPRERRLDVVARGVARDGKACQAAALEKIVAAAPDGTEFVFPAGEYYLARTVCLRGKKNVVFRGEPGARIKLHFSPWGEVRESNGAFHCAGCENLRFENFAFTTDHPSSCAGRIVAKHPETGTYDVAIDPQFPITGWEHFWGTDTCDDEGMPDYAIETYANVTKAEVPDGKGGTRVKFTGDRYEVIGPQLVRVTAPGGTKFDFNRIRVGHRVLYRYIIYGSTVFSIQGCTDVVFRDIEIERCASMGAVVSPPSRNVTFERFNMRSPKGSAALYCANADGIHILGLTGFLKMTDCHFDGLGDDALNIHAKSGEVKAWNPSTGEMTCICRNTARQETRLPHAWAAPGETLVVYDQKTLLTKGHAVLEAYADGKAKVKLAGAPDIRVGDYLANDKDFASVHISNCSVRNTRARALLLQSRNMTVENCFFRGLSLPGVIVATDFRHWNEVGPTVNTEIRNCVFEKCCQNLSRANLGALMVKTSHDAAFEPHPAGVHRDIRIYGNTFRDCGDSGVFVQSTRGVKVRGNRFERCSTHRYDERDPDNLYDIRLFNCEDVEVSDNATTKTEDLLLLERKQ